MKGERLFETAVIDNGAVDRSRCDAFEYFPPNSFDLIRYVESAEVAHGVL